MACVKKYRRQVIYSASLFDLDFPEEDEEDEDSDNGSAGDDEGGDNSGGSSDEARDLQKDETDCIQEVKDEYEFLFKKCACEKGKAVEAAQKVSSLCSPTGPLVMACREAYNSGRVVPEDWWLGPGTSGDIESRAGSVGTAVPFGNHPDTGDPWFFSVDIDYESERNAELLGCLDGTSLYWAAHTNLNRDAGVNQGFCKDVINRKYDKLEIKQDAAKKNRDDHANENKETKEEDDPCDDIEDPKDKL